MTLFADFCFQNKNLFLLKKKAEACSYETFPHHSLTIFDLKTPINRN